MGKVEEVLYSETKTDKNEEKKILPEQKP